MNQTELTAKVHDINEHLERVGSIFRTDDGLTIFAYIGHLTFLKRTFPTVDECLSFILAVKEEKQ